MRRPLNLVLLAFIIALTVFSVIVVWPGAPKRYLPDFIDWPEGRGLTVGGLERRAMRLGLDLKGGTYVLLEADLSRLPPGTEPDRAMDGAKEIIERRVNAFGVSETEISREGVNRLAVQLPGISPEEARELIGKTAQLEFRQPVLEDGQVVCRAPDGSRLTVDPAQIAVVRIDDTRVAQCFGGEGGSQVVGEVVWEPAAATDSRGNTRVLTGSFLRPTAEVIGPPPQVFIEFTSEGGLLFDQITTRLVGLPLGIFLDDELISAPNVPRPLTGGNAVITGLDLDEARTLAIQLNAGALPVPMRPIQETEVEATLGGDVLVKSVQAGIIGVLAVMAFMILYYRLPGLLASLALVTYISVVMMIYKLGPITGPVTITLAGIAGFVLSVGMAVDANILVFERMKEELRAGRNLALAVEHGFDRAWTSIRDSNVSTLITCVILYWFGDQFNAALVKGFAITLGIGVLVSMFSALTVTRTFLRLLVGSPLARRLWLFGPGLAPAPALAPAGPGRPAPAAPPRMLDFVRRRGFYFALSAVILLPGIVSLLVPPSLKPGIEFTSGATFTIQFEDESITPDHVRDALAELGQSGARVQRTSEGAFIIRTGELADLAGPPVGPPPPSERDVLEAGLEERLGPFRVLNFNQVSEIVSREIARNAAIAVGAAAVAILLYITWSFRHIPKAYRYGVAAIVAAMHDTIFVLGAFSILGKLFGMEINTMFITGLLTVIGYSVHDTIVVFDRVRENIARNPDVAFGEVVNASLNETVGRSLNTSITLLFTVVALLLLGAGTISGFLLVILLGVVVGTYSSIFIASQIVVSWEEGDIARLLGRIFPRRPLPAEA